jgi:peptidoglycan hydrolase-like protein with peptidoglycan-binding domain
MPINYQVQPGECISSIAYDHGFFPDTLWNHPNNAELKRKRKNLNVLMPGDVVFIPDLRTKEVSEPTNQVHKFRLKNVPAKLRIQFMFDGEPRRNVPYELTVDGKPVSKPGDRTDSEGFVFCSIAPDAKSGKLTLFEEDQEIEYELVLGTLNPTTDISGVHQRLFNLGHYFGPINNSLTDETKEAVLEFQKAVGLPETGELDEATKSKLQSTHDLL